MNNTIETIELTAEEIKAQKMSHEEILDAPIDKDTQRIMREHFVALDENRKKNWYNFDPNKYDSLFFGKKSRKEIKLEKQQAKDDDERCIKMLKLLNGIPLARTDKYPIQKGMVTFMGITVWLVRNYDTGSVRAARLITAPAKVINGKYTNQNKWVEDELITNLIEYPNETCKSEYVLRNYLHPSVHKYLRFLFSQEKDKSSYLRFLKNVEVTREDVLNYYHK